MRKYNPHTTVKADLRESRLAECRQDNTNRMRTRIIKNKKKELNKKWCRK